MFQRCIRALSVAGAVLSPSVANVLSLVTLQVTLSHTMMYYSEDIGPESEH